MKVIGLTLSVKSPNINKSKLLSNEVFKEDNDFFCDVLSKAADTCLTAFSCIVYGRLFDKKIRLYISGYLDVASYDVRNSAHF